MEPVGGLEMLAYAAAAWVLLQWVAELPTLLVRIRDVFRRRR